MLYASSRAGIVNLAQKEAGLAIAKKIEASEPEEVGMEDIEEEEVRPKVEVKRAFERPKRPGRR
jgi:twinfilin-like protein